MGVPRNDKNGVRNISKNSKSISKKNRSPRKDSPKIANSSRKKYLFKQGNISHYLEDTASEGGRGTLMKKFMNKNKNMAVTQFRPTLSKDHANFETSTIGTEVGGGMQLDGAGDEVGCGRKPVME